jgi:hypothetical protein
MSRIRTRAALDRERLDSLRRFLSEIGKYVDDKEVMRIERYVTIN